MNSPNTSSRLPPVSRLGPLNTNVLRLLRSSISSTLLEIVPFVAFTFSFHGFDLDPTVHQGEVIFLSTCIVVMAGCGFLSSLLQRKGYAQSSRGRFRRSQRRHVRKSSAGTVTSSDEDGYESSGSWQHVNEQHPSEEVHQKGEEPQDGGYSLNIIHNSCEADGILSGRYRPWPPEKAFDLSLLLHLCRRIQINQNILPPTPSNGQVSDQTITNPPSGVRPRPRRVTGAV